MADIRCLICDRVNDSEAERCWYCNSILPRTTGPLTGQEQEKIANTKTTPQENDKNLLEKPMEPRPEPASDTHGMDPTEDLIPNWLAHIRSLKQQEEGEIPGSGPHGGNTDTDWHKPLPYSKDDEIYGRLEQSTPRTEKDFSLTADESRDFHHEGDQKTESLPDREEERSSSQEAPPFQTEEAAISVNEEEAQPQAAENPAQARKQKPGDEPAKSPFLILSDDLPDWLSSDRSEATQKSDSLNDEDKQTSTSQDKKLDKAKLPNWLKTLRNLDGGTTTASIENRSLENPDSDLLAGIAGTLPGINLGEPIVKPQSFSQEMHVSPDQRKNAEIFTRLIHPQSPPANPPSNPQTAGKGSLLPRALIALLILLVVVFAYFSSNFHGITPVLYPSEVVDSLGLIESLPADKPVLLAAHFEAGLAGEINWTAQPVLAHLVSRGIPMTLTSTNAFGFAILEDQVNRAASGNSAYIPSEKLVDLGYLPGGAIGLSSLVSDPITTMPTTTDLRPAWSSGTTINIHSLSDFGAVILITDNPDLARVWVEQISQANDAPPLIAVVSAQAAPLLQPYYDSRQIRGYVAGLNGAIAYELIRGIPGSAYAGFGAYQVTLLLVALIIFTGGMVSLMITPRSTAKKRGEA